MKKTVKPLWRISVTTTPEAEDAVAELLASVSGAAPSTYYHLESQTSVASVFLEGGTFRPESVRQEIAAGLRFIRSCGLDLGAGTIEIARVKREDWAESWKRHFKPMVIRASGGQAGGSKSLLVKPSWSRRRASRGQAVVILDPGLSFGTGNHPTTSFCLRELVHCLKSGTRQSFLDIGTGSGILAIAATKLGYQPVKAFDFDPAAVRVARDNACKNRVTEKLSLTRGDVTQMPLRPARKYDLICANLIANLLMAERRRIVSGLKPGGTLVLAGILAAEFPEVVAAYAKSGLRLCRDRVENEWRSGSFCFM
jgi:ribosomal protein L11 methyltransferase